MLIQLLSYFSILFTFTLIIYWPFINHFKQGPFIEKTKPYIIGLKFGLAGLILTSAALHLMMGFIVNSRFILLLFSGLLGGPVALLISGIIMGVGRLFLENLTTVTFFLNLNFLLLTIVLFIFAYKYPMTRQTIFIYYWAALTEGIIVLFVGLAVNEIGFFYLLLYASFTTATFYFIYLVILQVKQSSDTVLETTYLQYIDYQTKLANNATVELHIESLIKKNIEFTILLIDINDFRFVNSTYGFLAGDALIQQIGEMLHEYGQKNDVIVGRSGGEEFVVILKNIAPASAIVEANHLIQAVKKHRFIVPKDIPIQLSISIGLCSYPINGSDLMMLTKNLLLAKRHAKVNSISSYFHASNLK